MSRKPSPVAIGPRVINTATQERGDVRQEFPANTTQPARIAVKLDDGRFEVWPASVVLDLKTLKGGSGQ